MIAKRAGIMILAHLTFVLTQFAQAKDFLPVSATMDIGRFSNAGSPANVWYEQGFNTDAPTTGLPPAGVRFGSVSQPDHFYVLSDYTKSNAALLDIQSTNAVLTLAAPAPLKALSILAAAAYGPAALIVVVHHEDGSVENGTVSVSDWFGGTNQALVANGRFDLGTRSFNAVSSGNPRLYSYDLVLTNESSPVLDAQFIFPKNTFSGAHAAVLALSGSRAGTFEPLEVSGFTQDVIIEAAYKGFLEPNLSGYIASVDPTAALPGENITVTIAVKNDGGSASPPSTAGVYLSTNIYGFDPSTKIGEISVPALQPNSRYEPIRGTFTIPAGLPVAAYYVSSLLDPADEIDERDGKDNRGAANFTIGPNLVVWPKSAEVSTNGDSIVTTRFGLQNTGTASIPTEAVLYFGTNLPSAGAVIEVARTNIPALARLSESVDLVFTFQLPAETTSGFYWTTLLVDPENLVNESFKADNTASYGFIFVAESEPPRISISSLSDLTVDEDSGPIRIPFTIQPSTADVTIEFFGDTVIEQVSVAGSGTNRVAVLNLRTNAFGTETVSIRGRVQDAIGSSAETQFKLTVLPVDDPPTLSPVSDQILVAVPSFNQVSIPFSDDSDLSELKFSISTENPDLFDQLSVRGMGPQPERLLVAMVPASNGMTGFTRVTVSITDAHNTVTESFGVRVIPAQFGLAVLAYAGGILEVGGVAADPAQLQSSSDLRTWQNVLQLSAAQPFSYKTNVDSDNQGFFRLLPEPR